MVFSAATPPLLSSPHNPCISPFTRGTFSMLLLAFVLQLIVCQGHIGLPTLSNSTSETMWLFGNQLASLWKCLQILPFPYFLFFIFCQPQGTPSQIQTRCSGKMRIFERSGVIPTSAIILQATLGLQAVNGRRGVIEEKGRQREEPLFSNIQGAVMRTDLFSLFSKGRNKKGSLLIQFHCW